ncbi:hypothetical protein FRB90_009925, partial [Tulasnella sp. 427]
MSIPRTPPTTRPSGGRAPGPATRSNRQPPPVIEPEPEDSQHPELGESPTPIRVTTAEELLSEEPPVGPDSVETPNNP